MSFAANSDRLIPGLCLSIFVANTLVSAVSISEAQNLPEFDAGLENQAGLAFSPDGKAAFWTAWNGKWGHSDASRKTIFLSRQRNGIWSSPAPAPFSGISSDDDPFVSPDGKWLYFVSNRSAAENELDTDIWRYALAGEERLERLSINSEAAEFSPVVTESGTLYFASARDGGAGEGDLYRARPQAHGFGAAEHLGPALNSPTGEWNLWVSADENEIVFEASSRRTNVSIPGDLYYSWRTPSGRTAAIPVDGLNSHGSDLLPRLHPNGETIYFTTAPIGGYARIASADWGALRAQLRDSYAPVLLVANRSSHEVTFVDLSLGEVVARIATGEGPHLLSNVSQGRVAATGYGEFPAPHAEPVAARPPFEKAPNSRLTLIDVASRTVLLDTVVPNCIQPHHSWILEQRVYVVCESEKSVLALNIENGIPVARFDTMQDGSHVLGFEPKTRTMVSSNTDSGSVTLINIDNGNVKTVQLAAGSEGILAVAGLIWVGNAIDGSITVVDPSSGSVVSHLNSVCRFPIALAEGLQDRVWVACFASSELVSIDRNDFAVKRRIGLGDQPLNLLIHPERELAYVSLPRQNAVAEIDLAAGLELRRIVVGIEPDGLRWATLNR